MLAYWTSISLPFFKKRNNTELTLVRDIKSTYIIYQNVRKSYKKASRRKLYDLHSRDLFYRYNSTAKTQPVKEKRSGTYKKM